MKEGQKDTVTVTSDQWLVWRFEGECTLESYLAPPNDVNFPYNIEYAVLKKYNENMDEGASAAVDVSFVLLAPALLFYACPCRVSPCPSRPSETRTPQESGRLSS